MLNICLLIARYVCVCTRSAGLGRTWGFSAKCIMKCHHQPENDNLDLGNGPQEGVKSQRRSQQPGPKKGSIAKTIQLIYDTLLYVPY